MLSIFANSGKIAYGVKQYILDTPEDLKDLTYQPAVGSTAFVISTRETYMINSEGIWTLVNEANNNSSGGSGTQGPAGASAYEIAVKHGFEGTEAEFAEALIQDVAINENLEWTIEGQPTGVKAQISDYSQLENIPTVDGDPFLVGMEPISEEEIDKLFPQD